jgi:hypothetical protein
VLSTGVAAYWVFANGDYCHIIVKFANPFNGEMKYAWMSFGKLNLFETEMEKGYYLMGQRESLLTCYRLNETADNFYLYDYFPGQTSNNYGGNIFLRIDQPSLSVQGWCSRGVYPGYARNNNTFHRMIITNVGEVTWTTDVDNLRSTTYFYKAMKNSLNSLAVTFPITFYLYDSTGADGRWIPIGTVPGMYFTRVDSFTFGERYAFGGLNYRPFTWTRIVLASHLVSGITCIE